MIFKFIKRFVLQLSDLFTYIVICFALFLVLGINLLFSPGPLKNSSVILIEQGDGLTQIGEKLKRENIVPSSFLFSLFTYLKGNARNLRYGEYGFDQGQSLNDVINHIASGKVILHKFLIKEGETVAEVRTRLAQLSILEGDLPDFTPEGVLLPETYHYVHGDKRDVLLKRMNKAMQDVLAKLWENRSSDLPFATPLEALTLASIVEKETALPEERSRVAAVFINRLKLGMPLQADPTVAYALTNGEISLDRKLTKKDLGYLSPYNTYVSKGLPPGPICNPGKASIEAVLKPLQTNELYFVVNGKGGHEFSKSLEEHNKNVVAWLRKKK